MDIILNDNYLKKGFRKYHKKLIDLFLENNIVFYPRLVVDDVTSGFDIHVPKLEKVKEILLANNYTLTETYTNYKKLPFICFCNKVTKHEVSIDCYTSRTQIATMFKDDKKSYCMLTTKGEYKFYPSRLIRVG